MLSVDVAGSTGAVALHGGLSYFLQLRSYSGAVGHLIDTEASHSCSKKQSATKRNLQRIILNASQWGGSGRGDAI